MDRKSGIIRESSERGSEREREDIERAAALERAVREREE